jgi:hypothetical protein
VATPQVGVRNRARVSVCHLPSTDFGRLWYLLDELWIRVRRLLWSLAAEEIPSIQRSPSPRLSDRESIISSMDAGEEAIAVDFINKVRVEIHHLPGNVRPRKRLIESTEEDWVLASGQ